MGARDKPSNKGTAPLNRVPPPNPDRTRLIREWHIDQAVGPHYQAALLNITLTCEGRIRSTGLGIEPEHAVVMLEELERIRDRLREYIGTCQASAAPVVTLPKQRTA